MNNPTVGMGEPFDGVLGQPQAVALLTKALPDDRISPAYLFAGVEGVGKRLVAERWVRCLLHPQQPDSVARRVAQRNHPDLLWVEPTLVHQGKRFTEAQADAEGLKRKPNATMVRLEQIRELAQMLSRRPLEAPRSVVVIEHTQTMAEPAANALLKTLEAPGQATIILLASSIESLLPTLVSRCQRIPFYRLCQTDMAQVLQNSGQGEILQYPEVLALAQGSPGAAIAHWQMVQGIAPELLNQLRTWPTSLQQALSLARQIAKSLDTEAQLWLLDYLQQAYWQSGQAAISRLQQLEQAKRQLRAYVQPQLVWEVVLMGAIA
jgi:DNA polymerase-3 subunit delta'